MKLKKKNLSNFIFIVLLGIILFTPIGFHARVLLNRSLSFSPSVLDEKEQFLLTDYSWQFTTKKGQAFDFNDTEGKVVLINFWATWCPPCVAEMPSLQKLYDDYGDQVEFILIANDEKEKVNNFLTKKQYTFPVYFENNSTPELLSVENFPATFIIDKKGKIIVRKIGSANWNSENTRNLLNKLLKQD